MYQEINFDLEDAKELGMEMGCGEYHNKFLKQIRNFVLASLTGTGH
jgi:hypothetical protein